MKSRGETWIRLLGALGLGALLMAVSMAVQDRWVLFQALTAASLILSAATVYVGWKLRPRADDEESTPHAH